METKLTLEQFEAMCYAKLRLEESLDRDREFHSEEYNRKIQGYLDILVDFVYSHVEPDVIDLAFKG